jgi:predicted dehydrogenase
VAPGHQLGFNDLKAIEIARFLDAIAGRTEEPYNFRAGLRVQGLVEAIQLASREGRWTTTAPKSAHTA